MYVQACESRNYGKNVVHAFINTRNPLVVSDENIKDVLKLAGTENPRMLSRIEDTLSEAVAGHEEEFTRNVNAAGYDGVAVPVTGGDAEETAAFSPNQIKSATDSAGMDSILFQTDGGRPIMKGWKQKN
jgi:hypothetical protein